MSQTKYADYRIYLRKLLHQKQEKQRKKQENGLIVADDIPERVIRRS